jgi:pyridoxal phosphate enzyme (YggS family)
MGSTLNVQTDIAANLRKVQSAIAAALEAADRDRAEVDLVAVSKIHPAERVRLALESGHRFFGENRVQEAAAKWPALKEEFPQARLHLIGPLQTNKVRDVLPLFDVIETVDRPKLARTLAAEMSRQGRRPVCFVQVNTGEEAQKAGVLPGAADAFIEECRSDLELPIAGLMCIPPVDEEPAMHFALLAKIAARNGLSRLSMGMSHDFEIAIAFGATEVRVGTAIFGRRPT